MNSGKCFRKYNQIKHLVKLEDPPEVTSEHMIMGPRERPAFSVKGDSGSWIINSSGNVIGMLLGGIPGSKTLQPRS
jgi:hypothetical protein